MSTSHIWGYKPDGIMVEQGDLLRWKKDPTKSYAITSITHDGVKIDYWSGQETYLFLNLADDCEYSKDDGQTWFACNKHMTPSSWVGQSVKQVKTLGHCPEPKPTITLVALSWFLCPLFAALTILLAIPGALCLLLERPFRKALQ